MKYLAATLSSAALAAAHGYVNTGSIGGETYTFYQPYQDPYTSPTPDRISRPIQGNGPVTDVLSADIQCGGYTEGGIVGSSPAALHAPVAAGSDVNLAWTLWPDSHFGALTTYMARCPDEGCQDYMPEEDAVWFKIAESGLIDKATDEWAVTPLMKADNAGYTYTIPECLASGYYLVRHEIIAVFVANVYPGVQVYPGCHQLEVTSSGTTIPSDGLVSFPGAYQPDDAGITWSSDEDTYPIPGPSVFTCGASSTGNPSTGNPSTGNPSTGNSTSNPSTGDSSTGDSSTCPSSSTRRRRRTVRQF